MGKSQKKTEVKSDCSLNKTVCYSFEPLTLIMLALLQLQRNLLFLSIRYYFLNLHNFN